MIQFLAVAKERPTRRIDVRPKSAVEVRLMTYASPEGLGGGIGNQREDYRSVSVQLPRKSPRTCSWSTCLLLRKAVLETLDQQVQGLQDWNCGAIRLHCSLGSVTEAGAQHPRCRTRIVPGRSSHWRPEGNPHTGESQPWTRLPIASEQLEEQQTSDRARRSWNKDRVRTGSRFLSVADP